MRNPKEFFRPPACTLFRGFSHLPPRLRVWPLLSLVLGMALDLSAHQTNSLIYVTHSSTKVGIYDPCLSANGKKVAYSTTTSDNLRSRSIWVADVEALATGAAEPTLVNEFTLPEYISGTSGYLYLLGLSDNGQKLFYTCAASNATSYVLGIFSYDCVSGITTQVRPTIKDPIPNRLSDQFFGFFGPKPEHLALSGDGNWLFCASSQDWGYVVVGNATNGFRWQATINTNRAWGVWRLPTSGSFVEQGQKTEFWTGGIVANSVSVPVSPLNKLHTDFAGDKVVFINTQNYLLQKPLCTSSGNGTYSILDIGGSFKNESGIQFSGSGEWIVYGLAGSGPPSGIYAIRYNGQDRQALIFNSLSTGDAVGRIAGITGDGGTLLLEMPGRVAGWEPSNMTFSGRPWRNAT